MSRLAPGVLRGLRQGTVIPAHPLALTAARKLDERRQRALTRYYLDAGAGGLAVGVHTTQFAIRGAGLLQPVLQLAAATAAEHPGARPVLVAGICGGTRQAVREARVAVDAGYDIGLVSLAALGVASNEQLIAHVRAVGDVMPVMGFYLQPAVGGRRLDYAFWRAFTELDSVVAIKIAPFDRYETLNVMRAVAESRRARSIALYTGNDDHILLDLVTRHHYGTRSVRMAGGLLGHWAIWTQRAVQQLRTAHRIAGSRTVPPSWLTRAAQVTDANAAIFDPANGYRGCIPGIHEILRRQGLLRGRWCLDPREELSPGQAAQIDRVCRAYPQLTDDAFVRERIDRWMRD